MLNLIKRRLPAALLFLPFASSAQAQESFEAPPPSDPAPVNSTPAVESTTPAPLPDYGSTTPSTDASTAPVSAPNADPAPSEPTPTAPVDSAPAPVPEPETPAPLPRPKVAPKKMDKASPRSPKKEKKDISRPQQSGTGYGIFGGADLGLVFTSPTGILYPKLESSQLGFTPTAKFLGTIFTRRIALDLGIGLQTAFYSGERIGQVETLFDENGEPYALPVPIKEPYSFTQVAMVIEGAARLKFKQKFQAGIVATALFSSDSAGFTSLRKNEEPNPESYLVLLGPQFIYETPFKNYISRIGGNFSISLTGSNRAAYLINTTAQLGSYLSDAATIVKTQKETKVKTKIVKEVISMKSQSEVVNENVSFIFDSQMINFKLNSAELSEQSATFISNLAQAFAQERELWEKLVIEGHTDSRGSENYNKKLSMMRAKTVTTEFEKAGLPSDTLVAVGLGSSRRLVKEEQSESDYAQNRRVEIKVLGLKNARKMQKIIKDLQEQYFGRSTVDALPASAPSSESSTSDSSGENPNSKKPPEPVWDPGLELPPGE